MTVFNQSKAQTELGVHVLSGPVAGGFCQADFPGLAE